MEEDELIPSEPTADIAQEEAHASETIPESSPPLIFEDALPSTIVMEPEQPQDAPATPVLDLNEEQPYDDQDFRISSSLNSSNFV